MEGQVVALCATVLPLTAVSTFTDGINATLAGARPPLSSYERGTQKASRGAHCLLRFLHFSGTSHLLGLGPGSFGEALGFQYSLGSIL